MNKEIKKGRKYLSTKTKLLIFEFKEKFSQLSPEELSELLDINIDTIKRLFEKQFIVVPSKMNKK